MIQDIKKIVNSLEFKCLSGKCTSNGKKYCLSDNQILCENCSNAHESFLNHDCISIGEYIESSLFVDYDFITNEIKDIDINKYNMEMDEKNKLFYITNFKNGFNQEAKIVNGEKWSNIGISNNEPFLLVSFIGYSGSGKSSCVSQLCQNDENGNFNHPIPAKNGTTTSTSSDINSFIGRVDSNDQRSLKYIILDSEGIGGTDIPVCLKKLLESINIYSNSFIESRNKIVQNCYPRFLYIVSDVIVFTFKGDPKEKNRIYKTIINFSLVSLKISYNQVKPQLIILLNKQSSPSDLDDIDNAKNDFFSNEESEEELKKYYQSISVIYLPNVNENNSFTRYQTQTKLLKKLVGEKVLESYKNKESIGYDTTLIKSMDNIRILVNYFNEDQNSNINLNKIKEDEIDSFETAQVKNKELIFDEFLENTPNDSEIDEIITTSLENLFKSILIALNNSNDQNPYHNTIALLKPRLKSIFLNISGYLGISIEDQKLLNKFKTNLKNFPLTIKKKKNDPHYSKLPDNLECNLEGYFEENFNEKELNMKPESFIKKNLIICIGCGIGKPIIPFSCDHIFCFSCANKSSKCGVPTCTPKGELEHRKEIDFNPAIGSRVLSLDGGGTRGIIQCCFLSILKSELFDIEIHNLFDLVVGTGIGGLISILISNNLEPDQILKTIESFNTKFHTGFIPNLFVNSLENTIFDTHKFHSFIDNIPKIKNQFIGTFSNTRVAVTSAVFTKNKTLVDSLFFNFYKVVGDEKKTYQINNISSDMAAKASCSAPPFFKGFEYKKQVHYDGGVSGFNNNPCNISKDLIDQIWGKQKHNDIFASLGAGESKNKVNNFYLDPIVQIKTNLLTKNEESWNNLLKGEDNLNKIRVNVELEHPLPMFSNEPFQMQYMKEKAMDFSKNKDLVNLINKSISSLFYLSDLSFNKNTQTLQGNINFRLNSIPDEIKTQLMSPQNQFYLLDNDQLLEFEIFKSNLTSSQILSFNISNPPEIINIVCTIHSKTAFKNETSISGCPFNIIKDLKKYNIKLINK
ncbi:hypothetical protein ACTFIR_012649 [Dictyostelium discoideum]